jgi:hypothetical protein
MVFDKDSYWEYKNWNASFSSTNKLDTIVVINLSRGVFEKCENKECYDIEYYKVDYKNLWNGATYSDLFFEKQIRRNASIDDPYNTGQLIFYNFVVDQNYHEIKDGLMEDGYYNKFIAGDKDFYKMYQFRLKENRANVDITLESEYKWAANFGMVSFLSTTDTLRTLYYPHMNYLR